MRSPPVQQIPSITAKRIGRFGDTARTHALLGECEMRSALVLAVFVCATSMQSFFLQFDWYRGLYRQFPFYVPETIKVSVGVILCCAVAAWLYGRGDHFALRTKSARGLLFGLVASSPLLIGFALTRSVQIADPFAVLFLAALFPLAEELMSRGFAFRLLWVREGWSWWMAAGIVAAVTGLAHIEKGQTPMQVLGLFAYTGLGGGITCWLLARWGSLWFPFGVHMFGNLWWELFRVSNSALGGWFAFTLQMSMIVLAVVITLKMTPRIADGRGVVQEKQTEPRGLSPMQLTMPDLILARDERPDSDAASRKSQRFTS